MFPYLAEVKAEVRTPTLEDVLQLGFVKSIAQQERLAAHLLAKQQRAEQELAQQELAQQRAAEKETVQSSSMLLSRL